MSALVKRRPAFSLRSTLNDDDQQRPDMNRRPAVTLAVTNEWTCDAHPCVEGVATDTHAALREHLGARWVLVEPPRNPRLSLFLLNDERSRFALETQRKAVFEGLEVTP